MPGQTKNTEQWSAETKLAVIVETATFSESELSTYCREKGLFVEQVKRWKQDCLQGFSSSKVQEVQSLKQAKADKMEIKTLKKELRIGRSMNIHVWPSWSRKTFKLYARS